MADSALVKKLLIKPKQRVAIVNPPAGYLDSLGDLPEGAELVEKPEGKCDFVHLFVKNRAELEQYAATALEILKYDGTFWISYPKGTSKVKSDINRDSGWDPINRAGLRPVSMIAIDDTWSALRFRPIEAFERKK
ncbi:MAG: hypothetical protein HYX94_13870 [Chloroflexi bacterium]|nr:hypothetical protein [Chloroflexota bacterium]